MEEPSEEDGPLGDDDGDEHGEGDRREPVAPQESHLGSVQQSYFGSQFAFRHFDLQIDMQIGAQMKRTVIPHLKPNLNTSKLTIEMQIEMKWYNLPFTFLPCLPFYTPHSLLYCSICNLLKVQQLRH